MLFLRLLVKSIHSFPSQHDVFVYRPDVSLGRSGDASLSSYTQTIRSCVHLLVQYYLYTFIVIVKRQVFQTFDRVKKTPD